LFIYKYWLFSLSSQPSPPRSTRVHCSQTKRERAENRREKVERESLERESKAQIPLFAIVIPVPFQRTHLIFLNFLGTGRFVIIIWVLSISIFFWVSVFSPQILSLFLFSPFVNRIFEDPLSLSRNSVSWVCVFQRKIQFFHSSRVGKELIPIWVLMRLLVHLLRAMMLTLNVSL